MADIHDMPRATKPIEREPETLEDALEIIRNLRAVGDELSDQIEALEEKLTDSYRSRRERLVEVILPKMIDRFGDDMGKYPETYGPGLISKHTLMLADTLVRDMDDN